LLVRRLIENKLCVGLVLIYSEMGVVCLDRRLVLKYSGVRTARIHFDSHIFDVFHVFAILVVAGIKDQFLVM